MKLQLQQLPKIETVTDQVLLCCVLILFGCASTMASLVIQEKPIPPDFKEFSERMAIGVFAGISFNRRSQ